MVGWQAVIASRLAPTGTQYIREILLGWQDAFAGKSDRRTAAPTGTQYIRKISIGWQAAIASKLAPTERQRQRQSGVHRAAFHHSSGRALARLQLLILIHPPPSAG
ncbi:hypothetical protein D3C84_757790 [compost metagenome]